MPTEAIKAFTVPHWARVAALALSYFAAAKASLVFAIAPGYATAVWPPSGIALGALLLLGVRAWPGVWLGAALTNYSIALSMPAALGIATGNTLEGVCAAWLTSRLADSKAEFRQPETVFLFAAIAASTCVIAATVGVSSLYLTGAVAGEQFLSNWYTWWQGDTTGILLVTPCVLAWARGVRNEDTRAAPGELALFGTLLIAMLLAVFARGAEGQDTRSLVFLAVPFFIWAACRFSERAVTLTVLIANGWAIWCTVNGLGPFQPLPLNEALLVLQAFTSTGALAALVLWSLLRQRAEALQQLQGAHVALGQSAWSRRRELRDRIDAYEEAQALAHVGSWTWDCRSNRLFWTNQVYRLLGSEPGQFEGSFEAYFERVHPADRERVRATIKDAYAKQRSWVSTERIVRPDSDTRVVRSIGRVTTSKDGTASRMQGVYIDLTAVEQLEKIQDARVLMELLRTFADRFERESSLVIDVVGSNLAAGLQARTWRVLLWIAQEAMHNAATYAHAHRVVVELECEAGLATLTVRDDGVGFVPESHLGPGTGITLMRERAEVLGARFWIESAPGSGTTVRVIARA
jgi:integral membrane sensor domain MASE1/anti-sigma regulatory factor (Ser/Thr protein kinase)